MGAIAFAFCWNPDNAHKTEHRAFLAQNQQPSAATEAFADAQLRPTKETQRSSLVNFPIFFERNGAAKRQCRVRACSTPSKYLCDAENRFYHEALSPDCPLIVLRASRCCHA
jgi:hypothetical protein